MSLFKKRPQLFQSLFIVLLGLFIFANSATINTFHYDDDLTILQNESIRSFNLGALWSSFRTRFIPGLTFSMNFAFGGLNPQGYHLVNVLVHVLTALMVWIFLKELLAVGQERQFCSRKFENLIPFFVALIFLVHPVQTEAVNFITQRYVLLAAFFYLATLVLYLKGRRNRSALYYGGAVVTCILAMLSKEIAFTLPFMIVLIEVFFFCANKEKFVQRLPVLIPFFVTLLIIPLTLLSSKVDMPGTTRIAHMQVGANNDVKIDITKAASGFSRKEYFLTELNVLRTYMRLLMAPVNLNLDYDYPIYRSPMNKEILISVLLISFLGFMAYRLFFTQRLVSFFIVWFFVVLSLESSFIPIAHVIAEYRLYLAVVGFAFLWVTLCSHMARDKHGFMMSVLLLVAVFSLMTHQRNFVWRSRFSLWEDTVSKSPYKPRGNVNLAKLYTQKGELNKAEALFLTALKRQPQDWRYSEAYTNLGVVYVKQGRIEEGIQMHEKAIQLHPSNYLPHLNLGIAYSRLKDFEKEIACYQKALTFKPNSAQVLSALGLAYLDNQQIDQARVQRQALKQLGANQLAHQLELKIKKVTP